MFVSGNNRPFCAPLFAFLPYGTSRLRVSTHLAAGVLKKEIKEQSKYRGKPTPLCLFHLVEFREKKIDLISSLRHI
jgi:hypothetical protein